ELVRDKGVGLLMTGGEESLGGDWQGTRIADALPVPMSTIRQVEGRIQMLPTAEGNRHFVLRLAAGQTDQDNNHLWQRLPHLDGYTKLDRPKAGRVTLAYTAPAEHAPPLTA